MTSKWSTILLISILGFSISGCDLFSGDKEPAPAPQPTEQTAPAPAAEPAPAPKAEPAPVIESGEEGERAEFCNGSVEVSEIPDAPVTGSIAGYKLTPNQTIVKASRFMRQVSLDFNQATNTDPEKVCFAGGSKLHAEVSYETDNITLKPGVYKISAANDKEPKWTAWYSYTRKNGTPDSINTKTYYGVVVIDSYEPGTKSKEIFKPAGKASGKLAICFGDKAESWFAGSFKNMPVCQ